MQTTTTMVTASGEWHVCNATIGHEAMLEQGNFGWVHGCNTGDVLCIEEIDAKSEDMIKKTCKFVTLRAHWKDNVFFIDPCIGYVPCHVVENTSHEQMICVKWCSPEHEHLGFCGVEEGDVFTVLYDKDVQHLYGFVNDKLPQNVGWVERHHLSAKTKNIGKLDCVSSFERPAKTKNIENLDCVSLYNNEHNISFDIRILNYVSETTNRLKSYLACKNKAEAVKLLTKWFGEENPTIATSSFGMRIFLGCSDDNKLNIMNRGGIKVSGIYPHACLKTRIKAFLPNLI